MGRGGPGSYWDTGPYPLSTSKKDCVGSGIASAREGSRLLLVPMRVARLKSSSGAGWTRRPSFARSVRQDRASRSDRFSEARALELRHPPVGIGAEFGREGLHGLERALDRGAVRDGLRGKEAHPRQLDVAGAESPALPALDGLARFGEERPGSGAIAGGPLRVRERRQDARLVPQCGAPRARERERSLERARGGGDVAGGELGGAEKRGGLDPGERASALFRQLDSPAAVSERAGEIAPQPEHLAQESVRAVQGFESSFLFVGEERFQAGPRFRP